MEERADIGTRWCPILNYIVVVNLAGRGVIEIKPRPFLSLLALTSVLHLLLDLLEQTVCQAELLAVTNLQTGDGDVALAIPLDLDCCSLTRAVDFPLAMQFSGAT